MLDNVLSLVFGLGPLAKLAIAPFIWVWLGLIAIVGLLFGSPTPTRWKAVRIIAALTLILFYVLSAGPLSAYLVGTLEQAYPSFQAVEGQTFDAIVVLTGDVRAKRGVRPTVELGYATLQRTLCGVDAFSRGLSPKLVMSGASSLDGPSDASEMADLARKLAVPAQALILEESSHNTYEEAIEVTRLLGRGSSVLLVTSALHIPRAVMLFKKQGLQVTPYPCGYVTSLKVGELPRFSASLFVPTLGSLERATSAINEFVGLFVYRLAGRL